jgi:hypothetical protein
MHSILHIMYLATAFSRFKHAGSGQDATSGNTHTAAVTVTSVSSGSTGCCGGTTVVLVLVLVLRTVLVQVVLVLL